MHARNLNPTTEQEFLNLSQAITKGFNDSISAGIFAGEANAVFIRGRYLIQKNIESQLSTDEKLKNLTMIFSGVLTHAMYIDCWKYRKGTGKFFYPLHTHLWDLVDQAVIENKNNFATALDAAHHSAEPEHRPRTACDKSIIDVGSLVVAGKLPFSLDMCKQFYVETCRQKEIPQPQSLYSEMVAGVQDVLLDRFAVKPTMMSVFSDARQRVYNRMHIDGRVSPQFDFLNSALTAAGIIYFEAQVLRARLTTEVDRQDLDKSLYLATAVLLDHNAENVEALRLHAATGAVGKPVMWKKLWGALSALAGIAVLALSIAGIPLTAGASLSAMKIGGSLLAAGGAAFFYSGTQGGFSKSLDQLANVADEDLKSKLELR